MNLLHLDDIFCEVAGFTSELEIDLEQHYEVDGNGYRLGFSPPDFDWSFSFAPNFAKCALHDSGRPAAVIAEDLRTVYREIRGFDGTIEKLSLVADRLGFVDVLRLFDGAELAKLSQRFCAVFVPTKRVLTGRSNGVVRHLDSFVEGVEAPFSDLRQIITERKNLELARVGQGIFRAELIGCFRGKCAITGFDFLPVLRASHIKAWSDSSDADRLDVENGLLLRADLDALFDSYHISFEDDGRLVASSLLPMEVLSKLGVSMPTQLSSTVMSENRKGFLACHRSKLRR